MKFSKVLIAVAALFAVSTVTPSSYLERAKAKAQSLYGQAKGAYNNMGGTEALQGYYNQGKGYYDKVGGTEGLKGYYGKAQDAYGKLQNYRGKPSAAGQAAEEANMEEMNAYAREQGLGTE